MITKELCTAGFISAFLITVKSVTYFAINAEDKRNDQNSVREQNEKKSISDQNDKKAMSDILTKNLMHSLK